MYLPLRHCSPVVLIYTFGFFWSQKNSKISGSPAPGPGLECGCSPSRRRASRTAGRSAGPCRPDRRLMPGGKQPDVSKKKTKKKTQKKKKKKKRPEEEETEHRGLPARVIYLQRRFGEYASPPGAQSLLMSTSVPERLCRTSMHYGA